jgi:hypothetical protein
MKLIIFLSGVIFSAIICLSMLTAYQSKHELAEFTLPTQEQIPCQNQRIGSEEIMETLFDIPVKTQNTEEEIQT